MTILMINQDQFGYKAGYYHYCKHLSKQGCKVIYLCNDHNLPRMSIDGVEVIYINGSSSVKWRTEFLSQIKQLRISRQIDVVLCSYFRGCSMLKTVTAGLPVIIDIRSGDLAQSEFKRKLYNRIIKFEASLFSRVMILSESLAKELMLKEDSFDVVPLGADVISDKSRKYNPIRLLYVGTLHQRNIHETIYGLAEFCKAYPSADVCYDIIGFGSQEEETKVKEAIESGELTDKVVFHGRVNYENLKPYFDKANVGVAFVPMTPYFDCQPSTKIYEYVLSGMFCLATDTYENRILIEPVNGMICDDTARSFCDALSRYYEMDKSHFNAEEIRRSMSQYQWENVINEKLMGLVGKVLGTR